MRAATQASSSTRSPATTSPAKSSGRLSDTPSETTPIQVRPAEVKPSCVSEMLSSPWAPAGSPATGSAGATCTKAPSSASQAARRAAGPLSRSALSTACASTGRRSSPSGTTAVPSPSATPVGSGRPMRSPPPRTSIATSISAPAPEKAAGCRAWAPKLKAPPAPGSTWCGSASRGALRSCEPSPPGRAIWATTCALTPASSAVAANARSPDGPT